MPRRLYTDKQLSNYHQLYISEQRSLRKFAKTNKISYDSLYNGFHRLGLYIIPQSVTRRKYLIDENYFDNIDTAEKAYFLGLLYADGSNQPRINRVELSLNQRDKDIIIKLSKKIQYGENSVRYYSRNGGYGKCDIAQLTLINNHLSSRLAELGCGPRKTFKITFPEWLEYNLIRHFTRGYFDGDGCLVIYERRINKNKTKSGKGSLYKSAEFNIVATKMFIDGLSKKLDLMNIPFSVSTRHKEKNTNTRTLRVHGNLNIRKICDWLYKDSSVHLNRKFLKYKELCEITKNYPYRSNYAKSKS